MAYIVTSKTRAKARRGMIQNFEPVQRRRAFCLGTPQDRARIQEEIKLLDRRISGQNAEIYQNEAGSLYEKAATGLDRKHLMDRRNALQRSLDEITPKFIRPKDKDRIAKAAKEFEREFRENSLSKKELDDMANGQRQHEWNQIFKKKVIAHRNIRQTLEPDDPNAGNIEKFRRAK